MLLHLKNLLSKDELERVQAQLGEGAPWRDGRSSAGGQALAQKNNRQLAQDSVLLIDNRGSWNSRRPSSTRRGSCCGIAGNGLSGSSSGSALAPIQTPYSSNATA